MHRRDERKRHEEALCKAAAEGDERVRAAHEEAKQERETLRRAHEKQVGLGWVLVRGRSPPIAIPDPTEGKRRG